MGFSRKEYRSGLPLPSPISFKSDSQLRNTFSYIYWFIVKGYGWGYKWTSSWKRCINSVQSLSRVWFFVTPWTAACQASLSITNSRSLLKLMSMESVMPYNHFILCCLLLLPLVFPSIRVFSSGSVFCIRWPQYWSFSISPSMNIQDWFPLGLYMGKDTELPCPNPILLGFFLEILLHMCNWLNHWPVMINL